MAKPKKITEPIELESGTSAFTAPSTPVLPLLQDFNHISEMNILRDKINEIIKRV